MDGAGHPEELQEVDGAGVRSPHAVDAERRVRETGKQTDDNCGSLLQGLRAEGYAGRQISADADSRWQTPHTRWEKRLIHAGIMRVNEYAMPGKALKLDRHGNVPRSTYAKILSQLQIGDSGIGNESRASKAAKRRRGAARYFVSYGKDAPRIGGIRPSNLPRGIWQRDRRGAVTPVFIFVNRVPDYADAFDWKNWADATARARLPINFKRSADLILRRPNR